MTEFGEKFRINASYIDERWPSIWEKFVDIFPKKFIDVLSEACEREKIRLKENLKEEIRKDLILFFEAKKSLLQSELREGVKIRKIDPQMYLAYYFPSTIYELADLVVKNVKDEKRNEVIFGDFLVSLVKVGKKCGFWPIC